MTSSLWVHVNLSRCRKVAELLVDEREIAGIGEFQAEPLHTVGFRLHAEHFGIKHRAPDDVRAIPEERHKVVFCLPIASRFSRRSNEQFH